MEGFMQEFRRIIAQERRLAQSFISHELARLDCISHYRMPPIPRKLIVRQSTENPPNEKKAADFLSTFTLLANEGCIDFRTGFIGVITTLNRRAITISAPMVEITRINVTAIMARIEALSNDVIMPTETITSQLGRHPAFFVHANTTQTSASIEPTPKHPRYS